VVIIWITTELEPETTEGTNLLISSSYHWATTKTLCSWNFMLFYSPTPGSIFFLLKLYWKLNSRGRFLLFRASKKLYQNLFKPWCIPQIVASDNGWSNNKFFNSSELYTHHNKVNARSMTGFKTKIMNRVGWLEWVKQLILIKNNWKYIVFKIKLNSSLDEIAWV
jgi:hypothetical protein